MAKLSSVPLKAALVVDSDDIVRASVANYLKGIGTRHVELCSSSQEATAALSKMPYQLMVCDWKLKNPTSTELYEALRENPYFENLPLIFLAGTLTAHDVTIASMDPRCKFILKPFGEGVLLEAVQRVSRLNVKYLKALMLKLAKAQKQKAMAAGSQKAGKDLNIVKSGVDGRGADQIVQGQTNRLQLDFAPGQGDPNFSMNAGSDGMTAEATRSGLGIKMPQSPTQGRQNFGPSAAPPLASFSLGVPGSTSPHQGIDFDFADTAEPQVPLQGDQRFSMEPPSQGEFSFEDSQRQLGTDSSASVGFQNPQQHFEDDPFASPAQQGGGIGFEIEVPSNQTGQAPFAQNVAPPSSSQSPFSIAPPQQASSEWELKDQQQVTPGPEDFTQAAPQARQGGADLKVPAPQQGQGFGDFSIEAPAARDGSFEAQQDPFAQGSSDPFAQKNLQRAHEDLKMKAPNAAQSDFEFKAPDNKIGTGDFGDLGTLSPQAGGGSDSAFAQQAATGAFDIQAPQTAQKSGFDISAPVAIGSSALNQQLRVANQGGAFDLKQPTQGQTKAEDSPFKIAPPPGSGMGAASSQPNVPGAAWGQQNPAQAPSPMGLKVQAPSSVGAGFVGQPGFIQGQDFQMPIQQPGAATDFASQAPVQSSVAPAQGLVVTPEQSRSLGPPVNQPLPPVSPQQLAAETQARLNSFRAKMKQSAQQIVSPRAAAVVDSDQALTTMVSGYLQQMGAQNVAVYSKGDEAWSVIQNGSFELVIMDWNTKGLNGLALYNRLRSHPKMEKMPLIVMSGSVDAQSFKILEESNATRFLRKPFVTELFNEALNDVLDSIASHSSLKDIVHGEMASIFHDDQRVVAFATQIAKTFKKPFPIVFEIGQILVEQKNYITAEKVLKLALQIDKQSMGAVSELAKVYHLLDKPKEALLLLKHANTLSPGNIERLCLMGEVGLSLNDTKGAQTYFSKVLSIDEHHVKAKAGLVISQNMEEITDLPDRSGASMNHKLASTLNVMGVTYIKNQDYKKGIEQYHAAMCFVTDPETVARLQFNLGMAYLRVSDHDQAGKWFAESHISSGGKFGKAQEYLVKLKKAVPQVALQAPPANVLVQPLGVQAPTAATAAHKPQSPSMDPKKPSSAAQNEQVINLQDKKKPASVGEGIDYSQMKKKYRR